MKFYKRKIILSGLISASLFAIASSEGYSKYRFINDATQNNIISSQSTNENDNADASTAPKAVSQKEPIAPPQDKTLLDYLNSHQSINKQEISKETHHFYTANNYAAVWFPNGQKSKAAGVALSVLQNAYEEGLNPDDYKQASAIDSSKNWVEAEIMLTDTFLKFIHDVRVGRIAANHVARTIKIISPETQSVDYLTDALKDSANNFAQLKEMGPELEDYKKLKALLAGYRQLAKEHQALPTLKKFDKKIKLKLGQSNEEVIKLKVILKSLGFLNNSDNSAVLDQTVIDGLKEFQRFHSLDDDGALGPETIKALNWSVEDRIKKIIVNMERLRWLPDHLGSKFIIVNVGGYEVMAIRNNKVEHRIKAIVGKKSRRTPLFYAPLKNVIINPSWGVPTSILVHDKIPKIINDPSYVERAGFSVYDSAGVRVDPYQVNWESEGSSMRLRQSPGAHNALGRIKFNIENPYTIYLHGTPEDKLFKKGTRNFSSGCIRLAQPTVLAEWILKEINGWGTENIEEKIKAGGTQSIVIKNSIPVYFTYMTVWVDDNGKSHFSPDAYDMDNTLIKALNVKTDVPLQVAVGKNLKIRYA
jgi:L,D-transpeptidase YcbB